jgi:hypothetical protein
MLPYYNSLAAIYAAQAETLAILDTEDVYACLTVGCCNLTDNQLWTYLEIINGILLQYALTGALPAWDDACCQPICGSFTGGTPSGGVGPTPTFTTVTAGDVIVTDDLTVGDDTAMTGDLVLGGAFTRASVVQPIYRSGVGVLSGGTATVTATWVTANTAIVVSYNTASVAAEANISRGTITPGANFVVNGEGTNTFTWIAIQNA